MRKKKKHGQSSRLRLFAIISTFLIVLLIGYISTIFVCTQSVVPYATQHWDEPHIVCPTEWVYPRYDTNNPQLMDTFEADNLPVYEVVIISTDGRPTCYDSTGTGYTYLEEVYVRLSIDENTSDEMEQHAILIHDVIAALSGTEMSQSWSGLDTLTIEIYEGDNRVPYWRMNYQEALRAYNEGLTGSEIYDIGLDPIGGVKNAQKEKT